MLAVGPFILTVFSLLTVVHAAPATTEPKKSIWTIDIDRDPAPSPEEGPPASAGALRDPSKLKFEAIGITGAYLLWIALTGVALLIVRSRLRKRRETVIHRQQMEAIKPAGQVTLREIQAGPKSPQGPLSPKSPGKMASIRSWARGNKARQSDISISTTATRIDDRVVDHDRSKNMDEMAKLYAAVMIHDEERVTSKAHSSAGSSPITDDDVPVTPRSPTCPPEIAHPAYRPPMPQAYQPTYPQAYQDDYIQAIHEQHEQMAPPPPPMDNDRQTLLDGQASSRKTKPAALSFISNSASRLGSSQSNKARPSPITLRGQPISKPLGSADLRQSALSPSQTSFQSTLYSPGPPPPTPGRGRVPATEEIEMHGRPQLTALANDSRNGSAKALPFREFYKESLQSAPPTKTTFVDRRTSAMNGPKTGVPKTPYSPYCPTTPMTPITPRRLLGKDELKKNKKQYALKAVSENEMVQTDDDMWGQ